MASQPHLYPHEKTGVWYFRMVFPEDVWATLGKGKKKSLRTKFKAEADRLVLPYIDQWKAKIAAVRNGTHRQLRDDDLELVAQHWSSDQKQMVANGLTGILPPRLIDGPAGQVRSVSMLNDRSAPIIQNEPQLDTALVAFCEKWGVPVKQAGQDFEVLRRLAADLHNETFTPVRLKTVKASAEGINLSAVHERMNRQGRTIADRDVAVKRFIDLHDDLPIDQITMGHAREFRAKALMVPRAMPNEVKVSTIRAQIEWADKHSAARISPASVKKQLALLRAMLKWAHVEEGLLDDRENWANPFDSITVRDDRRQEQKRIPIDPEQLQKVMQSNFCQHPRFPSDFWVPVLALFTGSRFTEVGQLLCEDVKDKPRQIPFLRLNITDDQGNVVKSNKNAGSTRDVPIHPTLVKWGFLRFVQRQREAGETKLFPNVIRDKRGKLDAFNKRLNKAVRKVVKDKRVVFHSLRHLFKDLAREAKIEPDVRDQLQGHHDKSASGNYGSGHTMTALYEAIRKMEFPRITPPRSGLGLK